ncbi:hypothetical protein M0804_013943 [Polistes exclamans]|nr:hypothetical protein M0804_013943 [Polistes exclamans]
MLNYARQSIKSTYENLHDSCMVLFSIPTHCKVLYKGGTLLEPASENTAASPFKANDGGRIAHFKKKNKKKKKCLFGRLRLCSSTIPALIGARLLPMRGKNKKKKKKKKNYDEDEEEEKEQKAIRITYR